MSSCRSDQDVVNKPNLELSSIIEGESSRNVHSTYTLDFCGSDEV